MNTAQGCTVVLVILDSLTSLVHGLARSPQPRGAGPRGSAKVLSRFPCDGCLVPLFRGCLDHYLFEDGSAGFLSVGLAAPLRVVQSHFLVCPCSIARRTGILVGHAGGGSCAPRLSV